MQPARIEVRDELPRTPSGKHDADGRLAPTPRDRRGARGLLEPLERFEAIRRRAVRLGDRLADLSYANPYEGVERAARAVLARRSTTSALLDLQYTPFGGQTLARRAVADALRASHGLPFAFDDVVLTPGRDVGAAPRAAGRGRPGRRGRDPGAVLARLPAVRARRSASSRSWCRCAAGASTSTSRRSPRRSARAPARSCSEPARRTRPGAATAPTRWRARPRSCARRRRSCGREVTLIADETHRDFVEPGGYEQRGGQLRPHAARLLVRQVPLHAGPAARLRGRLARGIPSARRSRPRWSAGRGSPASRPRPR